MKYIKSFETEAAFEAGKGDLSIPYVAYTQDDEQVHYARRLEDMYDIVGTLVPGTESFNFTINDSTITPTIIGDRFVYNWTGSTITVLIEAFRSKTALVSIDKFDVPVAANAHTNSICRGCTNLIKPFFFGGQTSIDGFAFYGCKSLTGTLTIPNSVTTIGNSVFHSCSGFTGSLIIPDSVTSIGNSVFQSCSGFNGALVIGNSVTSIGANAFNSCSGLTSVTIGNSVTSIGESAFYGCKGFTGSLTIPNSVTSIGEYAFSYCSGFNGALTIPNSVTSIGGGAFSGCKGFTGALIIGNSVTSIGANAFNSCSGLTSVTIGNSVTSIGGGAFAGCRSLTSITCLATTPPTLSNVDAFDSTNNCPIYVPAASVETYKAASGWSQLASRTQAIPNS